MINVGMYANEIVWFCIGSVTLGIVWGVVSVRKRARTPKYSYQKLRASIEGAYSHLEETATFLRTLYKSLEEVGDRE